MPIFTGGSTLGTVTTTTLDPKLPGVSAIPKWVWFGAGLLAVIFLFGRKRGK